MTDFDEKNENNTILYVIIFCMCIVIIYIYYESYYIDNFQSTSTTVKLTGSSSSTNTTNNNTSPTFDPYYLIISPENAKQFINKTPHTIDNIFDPINSNNIFYVSYYLNLNNTNYQFTSTSNSIIVYDFDSMTKGKLSSIFMTILYYTGTSPGTIYYYLNNTVQQTSINPNSYYLIYFIPVLSISTVPSIDSTNYISIKNKVYNTNKDITYNYDSFNQKFWNLYIQ
jgi:hypothetical protein